MLLPWRVWEDTFFPPPDNPYPHKDPQPHQQQRENPTAPNNHSSSSSSNKAHSEPTLDLSAWSPRSRQLEIRSPHKLNDILTSEQGKTKGKAQTKGKSQTTGEKETNLSAQPQAHRISSSASGRPSLRLYLHGNDLLLAVGNPIHINAVPFPLTLTIHACTLKPILETTAAAKAMKYNPLSLAHPPRGKGYLNLHAELYPLSQKMLEEGVLNVKEIEGSTERKYKPTITQTSLFDGPITQLKAHSKQALLPSLDVHLS